MTTQWVENVVFIHTNLHLLLRRSLEYCQGKIKMWDIVGDDVCVCVYIYKYFFDMSPPSVS